MEQTVRPASNTTLDSVAASNRHSDKVSEVAARMERLPQTSWQVKAQVLIGVATFFDAFDILAIAFVLPVLMPLWHIKPQNVGWLISSCFIGQAIGALLFGRIAERIGRVRTMIISVVFYALMAVCCGASWSYTSLFVFRLLQGIGLGGQVPIAATYISEILRAKNRGRYFLIYQLIFPIGNMISSFACVWIVPHLGWRWAFWVGAPVALVTILMKMYLPESPRWLANVGRLDKAEESLAYIEEHVKKASGADLPKPNIVPVALATKRTSFSELFSNVYWKRTLVVWVIWVTAYFANNGLLTWLPTIYRSHFHVPLATALQYGLIAQITQLVGSIMVAALIDVLGRRLLIGLCFILAGVFDFALWYVGASTAIQVLWLTSIAGGLLGGLCLVIYIYTPELYPTRMRALGCGVGSAWVRVSTTVVSLMIGYYIAINKLPVIFLIFSAMVVIAGIIVLLWAVETKGKVLEEISA